MNLNTVGVMGRVVRIVMLAVILGSGLAMAGCTSAPAPVPGQPPSTGAPDFELENLDGETVTLSGLRGRPVMLNFWASWCGPCRQEMPDIQQVFEDGKWKEQGLVILVINVGETPSTVREFIEGNGFSFPVLLDEDNSVARAYNIRGIPATFFIDRSGIIGDMKVGAFASRAEIDWRLVNSILDGE